jgi:hypothetical protein
MQMVELPEGDFMQFHGPFLVSFERRYPFHQRRWMRKEHSTMAIANLYYIGVSMFESKSTWSRGRSSRGTLFQVDHFTVCAAAVLLEEIRLNAV